MSSFLFLAMIFCCSVLYGLLRRFNTSRALPLETTLVARETPLDATIMVDASCTACVREEVRKMQNTTRSATRPNTQTQRRYESLRW
jgi:hypothetical protein